MPTLRTRDRNKPPGDTVKLTTRGLSEFFVRTSLAGTRDLNPTGKRSVSQQPMMNGLQMMSTDPEQVLNRAMDREKALSVGH